MKKRTKANSKAEVYDVFNSKNEAVRFIKVFDTEKGVFLPTNGLVSPEVVNRYSARGCIAPPVDRQLIVSLSSLDTTHTTCLESKTIAICGKGFDFKDEPNRKLKAIIDKPNTDLFDTMRNIIYAFTYEYMISDEAMLEILKIGDSLYIFNVPNRYMYVATDEFGRITAYWYISYTGKDVELIPYRGQELENGVRYVARLKKYNVNSSYYGFPRYLSAVPAMIENSLIRRYGIAFFDNGATPSFAILLTGGGLSSENETKIKEYLTLNLKGVDNAHRILMLNIDETDAKLDIKELSKTLDGSFLSEFEKNRDEIIRVHQIPPKMMGVSSSSGLNAGSDTIGSMKDFLERTIEPEQDTIEEFFSILFTSLVKTKCEFKFRRLDITNKKDQAVVHQLYSNIIDEKGNSVLTPDEIREEIGMPKKRNGASTAPKQQKEPTGPDTPDRNGVPSDKPRDTHSQNTHENPNAFDNARYYEKSLAWKAITKFLDFINKL